MPWPIRSGCGGYPSVTDRPCHRASRRGIFSGLSPIPARGCPWPPPPPHPSSPASISSTSTASSREEERAVRDTVRTWVDEQPDAGHRRGLHRGQVSRSSSIPGMAELGLFGANLPEEYGCAGLNNVAYGLIMQELERGDSRHPLLRLGAGRAGDVSRSTPSAPTSRRSTGCRCWPPAQEIGCFGLTEPDFGSNPGGMITTARETKDGWVLNGTKMWITNGSQATVSDHLGQDRRRRRPEVDPRLHRARPTPRATRPRTRRGSSRSAPATRARSTSQDVHLPKDAHPAEVGRTQEPAHVPHPGALRHRLGRHRRGDGVLRRGAALRAAAG